MLQKSKLFSRLKFLFESKRKLFFILYNDKIYIYQSYIMLSFLNYTNEQQTYFNKRMSKTRIVVENFFDLT